MQCETYNESADIQHIRPEFDGECKRKATKRLTLKNGKTASFCGYCARGWKNYTVKTENI